MKIFNLNVNDFGGTDNHLEEYKELFGTRWYTKRWDEIDKSKEIIGIIECIDSYSPDIVVFQEFDINSKDANDFIKLMENRAYVLDSESVEYKRPSMTVFFIKQHIDYSYVNVGHKLNGRAFAIKVNDLTIYGTHIPPKYNGDFWNELHSFIKRISLEKYVLIGDFNTINYKNKEQLNVVLENTQDVWKEKGNGSPISIMGDYVIASKEINMDNVEIDSFDKKLSDHPIIQIDIKRE